MNAALVNGDIDKAQSYLSVNAQQKYKPVFEALLPHMNDIVEGYSSLSRISVSNTIADYAVTQDENGRRHLYIVSFIKNHDGNWLIDGM